MKEDLLKTAAIIPAAGFGTRMQTDQPKQFLELCEKPILVRTVEAFLQAEGISEIIIAVPDQYRSETVSLFAGLFPEDHRITVVAGGKRRQDSVYNALLALSGEIELVLVHDGARPLVSLDLIKRCRSSAAIRGAAIAAIPVADTLKKVDADQITATVDRGGLYQAQTPQAMRKELLLRAYRICTREKLTGITDEASLLESAGIAVAIVPGCETNIKITRPEDLVLAERILEGNKDKESCTMRIGHGYDVHRFAPNRKLVLGGITIDYHLGLAGHSDADVVTHALCDALLGSVGGGDIGQHFPDDDQRYKDVYSILLLQEVARYCRKRGYHLFNADITVICQKPKLAPYLARMKELLAEHLQVGEDAINIKATTTEKLGFAGRKEGIACHAVVLVRK